MKKQYVIIKIGRAYTLKQKINSDFLELASTETRI